MRNYIPERLLNAVHAFILASLVYELRLSLLGSWKLSHDLFEMLKYQI